VKLTIALAELGLERGSDFTLKILKLSEKEQKQPDFLAVNPNGRIPAIVHHTEGRDIRVFESGAVLLYLAETFGGLLADKAHCAFAKLLGFHVIINFGFTLFLVWIH
jgi:GST-like protein